MPDKIFDILYSSIDQDQFAVATQWAKTFIHNPTDDLATNMTQLLMACVARGDFKTRSYLSKSSELQAPTDQLTIADYLSHASRIIIDYQSLSENKVQELLSYFPEASTTNGVFSRSATHNVNQVKEKVVEGKGFMIGAMGQLPSVIKTPRDFGVNIAMGGEGQDNFYGKKISTNGFSGHFYYHRNTEHKLLLAGLEQSAPAASPLELLMGAKKYSEDEQHDHDQFGQGHSLTGASDTYTAAGSLYFSHPVYQAKLLLEKGVLPPDKYGAMQVTITDDNWPFIKGFLAQLKSTVEQGDENNVVQQLLEKPSTAVSVKEEHSSFVALDFKAYLKLVFKVFIERSELSSDEQSTIAHEQTDLLILIHQLQTGNVKAYSELDSLMQKIMATTDGMPAEVYAYKKAILRIGDLFKLQLSVDPELKNTQVSRQYQFGDMTWGMLGKVNQMVNGSQMQEEGAEELKEYEFGDITWGILNRINQQVNDKKEYQFGDFTWSGLRKTHEMLTGKENYQFGDITWHLLGWNKALETPEDPTESVANKKAPQTTNSGLFGYARNLIWGANKVTVVEEQPKDDNKKDSSTAFDPTKNK